MKIQPFGERIVVRLLEVAETTNSGIVLTTIAKDKSNRGIVEALGNEVGDYIQVGDTVVFNIGAGTSYSDDSNEYKILNIRDILGKIVEG